jgi:hypothetical protein
MPLFRRFGRPGLLGAVARTAVVAGTATMTARAINGGLNRRAQTQAEATAYEQQHGGIQDATVPEPPPTTMPDENNIASQLSQLAALHDAGTLTRSEYETAKARVLAG